MSRGPGSWSKLNAPPRLLARLMARHGMIAPRFLSHRRQKLREAGNALFPFAFIVWNNTYKERRVGKQLVFTSDSPHFSSTA
jgi:translation elongation factor EF-1alpha